MELCLNYQSNGLWYISQHRPFVSSLYISARELGTQRLCCPCRHHIGKTILSRVWKALQIEQF